MGVEGSELEAGGDCQRRFDWGVGGFRDHLCEGWGGGGTSDTIRFQGSCTRYIRIKGTTRLPSCHESSDARRDKGGGGRLIFDRTRHILGRYPGIPKRLHHLLT